jgi:signal transduction histidine kinase
LISDFKHGLRYNDSKDMDISAPQDTIEVSSNHQYYALYHLAKILLETLDYKQVVQNVVDGVFNELQTFNLGYQIVVLSLADTQQNLLKRISISQTPEAVTAVSGLPIPYSKVEIPLNGLENYCVRVMHEMKPLVTHDWKDILCPPLTEKEASDLQSHVGIKTSMVFPLIVQGQAMGSMIFSTTNERNLDETECSLLTQFTDIVGVAVQNAKLYGQVENTAQSLAIANNKLKELDQRKNEFLNMAAHELRAPMTAIKGYISMLIEGDAGEIPEKARGFLTDAQGVTDRLIRLVNNMLNVSRIEENRLVFQIETVSLSEVARTVFSEFKGEAVRKNLKFNLVLPPEVKDRVTVDPDRIHEVIANFISNAIKYTETGAITISLSQPNPQTIRCDVVDTGPGISPEEQVKLFQKFVRAESAIGKTVGTGLGLYISKILVEKFKGKTGLQSEVGKGSDFWFELPLATEN